MDLKKLLPLIQQNISLAPYTTFKIGGPARYFYVAKSGEDVVMAVKAAQRCRVPFFILGGGSNILVSDEGFDGLVVKILNTKYKILNTKIFADAGASLGLIVGKIAEAGLSGLEWAAGIPGTVGGAVRGNAGAFGFSMADVMKSVRALEIRGSRNQKPKTKNQKYKLKIKKFTNNNCKFKYRDSIFKQNKSLIILSAELKLKNGNKEEIKEKMREYLEYRRQRHPLEYPSAGSVFKNYELRIKNYGLLFKKFPELEQFRGRDNIPAAYLIAECGLKGKKIGGAIISAIHPNFILNIGGAKAKDVVALIEIVKQEVKKKFGVKLEEEIQYLGFSR